MPTNSYTDYLVFVAKLYWSDGEPCPVDILFNLAAQGVDAHALELEYHNSKGDEYLLAISDEEDRINPNTGQAHLDSAASMYTHPDNAGVLEDE